MAEKSAGEKTEQATPRRRLEARKKGTVAKSNDLTGALGMLTVVLLAPTVFSGLSQNLLLSMSSSMARLPSDISFGSFARYLAGILGPGVAAIAPLILSLMVVGLASNFAQVGFVMSAEGMNPSLDKLNPLPGIQRMFSVKSTFEGIKATAKMFVFGLLAYSAIREDWSRLTMLSSYTPVQAGAIIGSLAQSIMTRIAIVWLIIAVADYLFQRKQVDKQLMMTKDELRREMKEQEGSPEVKSAQMQRRRKLAKGGLSKKLKEADVLITNPTHFAVAIKYDRSSMFAPIVLAKGQDLLALRIKELAKDFRVPIIENKLLARALYKQCEAGDIIPRDLFGPVAEILAYVYKTTQRVKST